MRRKRKQILFVCLITMITVTALALVAFSPFALNAIPYSSRLQWAKLSDIGQTYGAVSALVAALALVGVAISIFVQSRELRHNRWAAGRTRHFEIMRMAIEDPFYQQIYPLPETSDDESRLEGYINLLLEYWIMLWEFGDMPEERVRSLLADIFKTEAGYSYWTREGNRRLRTPGSTKREYQFQQIANEIYKGIVPAPLERGGAPASAGAKTRTQSRILQLVISLGLIAVGFTALRRLLGLDGENLRRS